MRTAQITTGHVTINPERHVEFYHQDVRILEEGGLRREAAALRKRLNDAASRPSAGSVRVSAPRPQVSPF